jgi:molecular chaperone GrpE
MSSSRPKAKSEKLSITELQQKIGDLTEALQRERADSLNIRRRQDEQIASLKDLVKVSVVEDLLPVIDNFERALKHVPKDLENNDYVKGVSGVVKQFEDTLKQMGVEKIKTVGEHFDPNLHEAVGVEGDENELSAGTEVVSEELQSGYKLNDVIIRHAMVKVKKSNLKGGK